MTTGSIVLYFNGPFVRSVNGADVRVNALMEFLHSTGHAIHVYSFENHIEAEWTDSDKAVFHARYPKARLTLEHRSRFSYFLYKSKKLLSSILPGMAGRLVRAAVPGMQPLWRELLRSAKPDLIFVNYANGLLELNGLDPSKTVIESHDLDFVQFSLRFGRRAYSLKIVEKYRSELALLETADAVIAISPVEAGLFRMLIPNNRIFYIPEYSDSDAGVTSSEADYDLLFVGSDNPFNLQGLLQFLDQVYPRIDDLTLAVAGSVCKYPEVVDLCAKYPHVTCLGFVDDIGALYARSRAVLSPVGGTGLKMKITEALRHGRPVFASAHSRDGLPGRHDDCVFDLDPQEIRALLSSPDRLASAGSAAIRYAASLSAMGDLDRFRAFINGRTEPSLSASGDPLLQ